jgi:hypothetical protein
MCVILVYFPMSFLWLLLAFKITSFYSHSHLIIIWAEYHIEIESLRLLLQDS